MLAFVLVMSAAMLTIIGMAVFGSFVKVWPYNLSFTLNHYTYGFEEAGVENAYLNSLVMAASFHEMRGRSAIQSDQKAAIGHFERAIESYQKANA